MKGFWSCFWDRCGENLWLRQMQRDRIDYPRLSRGHKHFHLFRCCFNIFACFWALLTWFGQCLVTFVVSSKDVVPRTLLDSRLDHPSTKNGFIVFIRQSPRPKIWRHVFQVVKKIGSNVSSCHEAISLILDPHTRRLNIIHIPCVPYQEMKAAQDGSMDSYNNLNTILALKMFLCWRTTGLRSSICASRYKVGWTTNWSLIECLL
jgi:hypothetical protein